MIKRLLVILTVVALWASGTIGPSEVYAAYDTEDDSLIEVGVEWIVHYDDLDDLPYSDDSAEGFYYRLGDAGWSENFNWGDDQAFETDFKRDDPPWYGYDYGVVDKADIVWFSGHGDTGRLRFNIAVDDLYLMQYPNPTGNPSNEARWGDLDLEWIFLSSCKNLNRGSGSYKTNYDFGLALNGIHLICGAKSDMWDRMDGPFVADYLIDDGYGDQAYQVMVSWWYGCDIYQPSFVELRCLGENSVCGNDYIWGQGSVCPDQPVNPVLSKWDYRCM